MDPAQTAAKQQIVERVKQANNILVTVSKNPSVDQLAACIGVTILLNRMDKHATAVFSGQVPSTLEFLQPQKTIESNTDSLRDFIISLDKAKADKLRYKVEDQFVRIYITPYKTSLSEKDLVFSEGEFNVEVVLALGVKDRADLDAAITQHGRILHNATVISVNSTNDKQANIGQINWQEPTASSLCEMLVSISEAFGAGLIDNQMATAFLTGIVAETERFSNPKTSPKVMTMSAQLMAAGANQQLIVSKLEPPEPPPESKKPVEPPAPPPEAPPAPSDTLTIPHDDYEKKDGKAGNPPDEIHIDNKGNIIQPKGATDPNAQLTAAQRSQPKLTPGSKSELAQPLPASAYSPDLENDEAMVMMEPEIKKPVETPAVPAPAEVPKPTAPSAVPPTEPNTHALIEGYTDQGSKLFAADTKPTPGPETSGFIVGRDDNPPPKSEDTPTFPTPTVDDARNAVANAMASMPHNDIVTQEAKALPNDLAKPAPPPVPPPLQFATQAPPTAQPAPQNPNEVEKLAHTLAKPL
jgi:hypothetical protein